MEIEIQTQLEEKAGLTKKKEFNEVSHRFELLNRKTYNLGQNPLGYLTKCHLGWEVLI